MTTPRDPICAADRYPPQNHLSCGLATHDQIANVFSRQTLATAIDIRSARTWTFTRFSSGDQCRNGGMITPNAGSAPLYAPNRNKLTVPFNGLSSLPGIRHMLPQCPLAPVAICCCF